jgi:hypothetical protein
MSNSYRKVGRPRKPDAATTTVPVQLSKATVKALDRLAKESGIGSRSGAVVHSSSKG